MIDSEDLKLSLVALQTEMKVAFKILNELNDSMKEIRDNHLLHMANDIQELKTKMQFVGAIALGSIGVCGTLLGVVITKLWK